MSLALQHSSYVYFKRVSTYHSDDLERVPTITKIAYEKMDSLEGRVEAVLENAMKILQKEFEGIKAGIELELIYVEAEYKMYKTSLIFNRTFVSPSKNLHLLKDSEGDVSCLGDFKALSKRSSWEIENLFKNDKGNGSLLVATIELQQ